MANVHLPLQTLEKISINCAQFKWYLFSMGGDGAFKFKCFLKNFLKGIFLFRKPAQVEWYLKYGGRGVLKRTPGAAAGYHHPR